MANNLGSLVVSLGLDAAEFTRGLSKSEYQAQQFARNVEKGIEFARNSFVAFAGAAVAAIAVVNRQAENVAAFQGLAEKIGDTAESVASLKLASDISGVAMDSIAAASVKLTSALAKTDDEAKGVGAALGAIGLSVEAFKRLSPVEQIDAVAQAFAGYEDGAQKTAVAVQLFGRSGAELIPLFNDLADGAERQVRLTQEQIDAADKYTKQTARLRSEIDTLVQTTAADAIPALSQMATVLQDVLRYATSASEGVNLLTLTLGGAQNVLETLVVVGSDVAFIFRTLGDTIGAYLAVAERLVNFDLAGAKAIGEAYRANSEERRKSLDAFQKQVLNPVRFGADDQSDAEARRLGLIKPRGSINFNPNGPGKGTAGKDPYADAKRYMDSLNSQLQATEKLSVYETALREIQSGRLGSITAKQRESILNTAAEIDASKEFLEIDRQFAELDKERLDRQKVLTQQGKQMYEATRTPAEALSAEIENINRLLAANAISWDTAARAQFDAQDRFDDAMKKTNEQIKQGKTFAEEFGLSFTSAFEDAIVSGAKLSDTLKGLADDIIRIIVRQQVTEPLGNAVKGFDFGGFFKGLISGTRANGGPVTGGASYLVGERGPEVFTPSVSGRITANGAGGGVAVTLINQSGTPMQATAQQKGTNADGQALIEVVLSAVGEALASRSGPAARGLESGYGLRPAMS